MIGSRRLSSWVVLLAAMLIAAGAFAIQSKQSARAVGAGRSAAPQPQLTGCVPKGARFRESGWRGRRWVALTFDGGPTSQYTSKVLAQLRKAKVHVTFFIRGQFIDGHTALLRKELAEGHELANHSYSHPHFPASYDISRTTKLIRDATGYRPCLFRAPYGSVDDALFSRVRHQRMLTIGWDVDSWDSLYDNVSKSTIYSRVVNGARPGSIILMHDGEGSHQGTLQALGPILRNLKRRHLQVVPVSKLLGLRQRTSG
ncbi:MAG: polysaccharide deacetylase family protein [Solirubrobacteraceae bacterium]|nr:polysaccharide deacetylase family protein [Solirubrobacteraceae bacterium]